MKNIFPLIGLISIWIISSIVLTNLKNWALGFIIFSFIIWLRYQLFFWSKNPKTINLTPSQFEDMKKFLEKNKIPHTLSDINWQKIEDTKDTQVKTSFWEYKPVESSLKSSIK